MNNLPQPQSQRQEVLYYLLKRFKIDRRQMMLDCSVYNLPDVIMKLRDRHGLPIETKKVQVENKFGREVEFGEYYLTDKKKGRKVYEQLQNQSNGSS